MPTIASDNSPKAPQPRPKGSGGSTGTPSAAPGPGHFLKRPFVWFFLCLLGLMVFLFHSSFDPDKVHFSNDAPLGAYASQWEAVPSGALGIWDDLNSIGFNAGGSFSVGISLVLRSVLGPLWYSKVFPPLTLLFLGCCAWLFFRCCKLSPLASALGGLAAALNSGFLSATCWGVGTIILAFGAEYLALAAIVSSERRNHWLKIVLAGFAVGIGIIEGLDNGAIFSMFVAAFVVYFALTAGHSKAPGEGAASQSSRLFPNLSRGVAEVAVIAVFAAFISIQTVSALVNTQIRGVVGTKQDTQSKAEHWDYATQWSLPKRETLSLIVPGLFGYRMDTLGGGSYWGAIGRDPSWDRYFASGKQGAGPGGIMRFSGGGSYTGVLVVVVACWAALQALRRKDSVFDLRERRLLWFWSAAAVISLLMAFGRFAPFYQLLYALPYFSTIRNPVKFLSITSFALIVLFAYGIDGLWRRHLSAGERPGTQRFKDWWARAKGFDKKWVIGCGAVLVISLLGWMIYDSEQPALERYLQSVQIEDPGLARSIAQFSIQQVGWFVLFFFLSAILIFLAIRGVLSGRRAKWAGFFLGLVLVSDLVRANDPWIVFWDYKQKYASNEIIDLLREKPYEHRVASLPRWMLDPWFRQAFSVPAELLGAEQYFRQLYTIEWAQHHFLYYNVQSLDLIQMPRMPEDLAAFEGALSPRTGADLARVVARRWELTNTRYLLGTVAFLDFLNQQLDPGKHRFRIVERFNVVPKPGVVQPRKLEELTAVPETNGMYALFEFTGALPRAKVYARWQVSTNDQATLQQLASADFDPGKSVLVANPIPASPANTPSGAEGSVEFASYAPKQIILHTKADFASVLLLNDKFDPAWKVTVDGKPEALLRCNYIMRGVRLDPGAHTVEFRFEQPLAPFYISLVAIALACALLGIVIVGMSNNRRNV